MSYVDAIHDRENDEIKVVERVKGKRRYREYKPKYQFYYTDPKGQYRSIFDDKLSRYSSSSYRSFKQELSLLEGRKIFESDINPIFRCLGENYANMDPPDLHVAFFDIETDFDAKRGFSTPDDPFNAITAISVYLSWSETLITLTIKPNRLSVEEASTICDEFENTFLCETEQKMLELFLQVIEDADILSGWNSTGYDIPYIVNRMTLIMGKEYTRQLCLWDQYPKKHKYIEFKVEKYTYDLVGRVHMDYLDLYKKHTYSESLSYKLDYVAKQETGDQKVAYEGSLDRLYNYDYKKFIEYNRQDVMLLVKIDKKRKFISLSNQLAHSNTVLLKTTLGSVALIEQAITNYAHSKNLIVPNRKARDFHEDIDSILNKDGNDDEEDDDIIATSAAGAYVADPKIGLHDFIGGVDINSLYPSTIRALNMGPETLVGQIRQTLTHEMLQDRLKKMKKKSWSEAWAGVFSVLEYDEVMNQTDTPLILDLEDGTEVEATAKELYQYIYESGNPFCLSANGTIFRTDQESLIAGILTLWFAERRELQAKYREFVEKAKNSTDPVEKAEFEKQAVYWDQSQHSKKILLNSLYGTLLNEVCKFYDSRIGQSVTLTGRMISKHMGSKISEIFTGKYTLDSDVIVYGDTDSILSNDIIHLQSGSKSVYEAFMSGQIFWKNKDKEYSVNPDDKILTYDPKNNEAVYKKFNYIYRHKVSKKKWKITDQFNNEITVTEDHSIMVERNNELISVKPNQILEEDILISVNFDK